MKRSALITLAAVFSVGLAVVGVLKMTGNGHSQDVQVAKQNDLAKQNELAKTDALGAANY
jgi:hypothetical protein